MGERPEDLDAVALGLKRGKRGAVTVVLAVALAVVGLGVLPTRAPDLEPATELAQAEPLAVPVPTRPKPPVVNKRSRTARAAPRAAAEQATVRVEPPAERAVEVAIVAQPPAVEAQREVAPPVEPSAEVPSEAAAAAPEVSEVSEPPPAPAPEPVEEREGNGEAIARAIAAAKRAAVRECFERELKQTPRLTGTVVVELDLVAPNTVNDVRVTDDLERPDFTRCVARTMHDVRFAALDEDISVRVPYALKPERK